MGGDHAPRALVRGVGEAVDSVAGLGPVTLVGDEAAIRRELALIGKADHPLLGIVHAPEVVGMDEPPSAAIRAKKRSSITVAMELVKQGQAAAVVSAGNTGATLMAATVKLRTLPGIERAAIATLLPHRRGRFVMLDSGANSEAKPEHLVHFAVMGDIYARHILGIAKPRVGLLSNGTEDEKGNELTKAAFGLLRQVPTLEFVGNVEGNCLFEGKVDVVVCDGFTGNVVLKTAEGLAKLLSRLLKEKLKKNPLRLMGGMLAYGALRELRQIGDYTEYGGAPFLGVNGVVFKCHGGSNAKAVRNAIRVAHEFVSRDINNQIVRSVQALHFAPATAG
jgi:glycerol-3-phosphate acyltransferase PlsX